MSMRLFTAPSLLADIITLNGGDTPLYTHFSATICRRNGETVRNFRHRFSLTAITSLICRRRPPMGQFSAANERGYCRRIGAMKKDTACRVPIFNLSLLVSLRLNVFTRWSHHRTD